MSCDYPSFTWLCYGGAPRTVWTYSKNMLQNISAWTSHFILSPPVSTLTVSLSQLWKWFGKLFSLWASVGRFKHRKSHSLADDVTVVEVLWWGTVTQPPPHMHVELSRGMWGQSLLIDHQRWNARYRNGKLNSRRKYRRGSVLSSQPLILWNIRKKKLRLLEGKKSQGVEEMRGGWGHLSLVWGLEVREMAQNKKFPFESLPHFLLFHSTRQWTLSEVQIHCHSEWMNEWWHGKVSGYSRFELWLLTNWSPCHLYQPKTLHMTWNPVVPLDHQCHH